MGAGGFCFGVLGLVSERSDGDLGGIQKLGAFHGVDGGEDHALGGAGDEVAAVLVAGKVGHGAAVGIGGFSAGAVVVDFLGSAVFKGAQAGVTARLDGCAAGRNLDGIGLLVSWWTG